MTRITYLDRVGPTYYFRRAVPPILRGAVVGDSGKLITEWRYSLRTKELAEAKRLLPQHIDRSERAIAAALVQVATRTAQASQAAHAPSNTVDDGRFAAAIAEAGADWERQRAALADIEETRREDDPLYDLGARQVALLEASEERANLSRLNVQTVRALAQEERAKGRVPIMALFDSYIAAHSMTPRTAEGFRSYVLHLSEWLSHDDADSITLGELRDWRNALRDSGGRGGKPLSSKTINGSYLAAVRAMLSWAQGEGLIQSDPGDKLIPLPAAKKSKLREKSFTDAEARTILRASIATVGTGYGKVAQRWIPWLCAYSGARVNEMTQLRKQDVQKQGSIHFMKVTPDAGPQKARQYRDVPLHPHLVEQGFLAWVAGQPDGPLFFDPAKRRSESAINRQNAKVGQRLGDWVRSLGITGDLQPNHAWRHRFIERSYEYGIDGDVRRAIEGHAGRDVAEREYAGARLEAKAAAIALIPKFVTA